MKTSIISIMLLLFMGCVSTTHNAQTVYYVRGTLLSEATGKPIYEASVVIKKTGKGVLSDEAGKFAMTTYNPNEIFVISMIGYDPMLVRLNSGSDTVLHLKESDPKRALDIQVIKYYHTK